MSIELCCQMQLETMRCQADSTPMTVLTQSLLSEKNAEIDELTADVDHLNTEIERLKAAGAWHQQGAPLSLQVMSSFSAAV